MMSSALPKIPDDVFGQDSQTQIIETGAAARTFLRFAGLVWQAGLAPSTVRQFADLQHLSLETVSYQVRQLLKHGLLQTAGNGPARRGQRYVAKARFLIPHTALPQQTVSDFLKKQFIARLDDLFTGYERHVRASDQPWWLELDFRREDYLHVLTSDPVQPFPPLFSGLGTRFSARRAAQFHDELGQLLQRYMQPEPEDKTGQRYYLMLYFAKSAMQ